MGLDRLVIGLDEFGSEWNKMESPQIALIITWVGSSRRRMNLGLDNPTLRRNWLNLAPYGLGLAKVDAKWTWVGSNWLSEGFGSPQVGIGWSWLASNGF